MTKSKHYFVLFMFFYYRLVLYPICLVCCCYCNCFTNFIRFKFSMILQFCNILCLNFQKTVTTSCRVKERPSKHFLSTYFQSELTAQYLNDCNSYIVKSTNIYLHSETKNIYLLTKIVSDQCIKKQCASNYIFEIIISCTLNFKFYLHNEYILLTKQIIKLNNSILFKQVI